MQAHKVCQLGQNVCSAGNTFEKDSWGLPMRAKSSKQRCPALYNYTLFITTKTKSRPKKKISSLKIGAFFSAKILVETKRNKIFAEFSADFVPIDFGEGGQSQIQIWSGSASSSETGSGLDPKTVKSGSDPVSSGSVATSDRNIAAVSDLTRPRFEPQTSSSTDKRVTGRLLPSHQKYWK